MRFIKYISLILVALTSFNGMTQDYTSTAYQFYQAKDFDSARFYIDKAVVSSDKDNTQAWQLRGVIYRQLETENGLEYREIAIKSFVKAKETDENKEYTEKINSFIFNTNVRYYNDAVELMGEGKLTESEISYEKYKENYIEYISPAKVFDDEDIEYYNVLGGAWFKLNYSVEPNEKQKVYDNAIKAFLKVIEIDKNNYTANYGIGISYYNQGADYIIHLDPFESDLEKINYTQGKAIEMFRNGEPYLKTAYQINPNEKEVVEGLTGIYYGLNEEEEYNYFKNLLDKMEK